MLSTSWSRDSTVTPGLVQNENEAFSEDVPVIQEIDVDVQIHAESSKSREDTKVPEKTDRSSVIPRGLEIIGSHSDDKELALRCVRERRQRTPISASARFDCIYIDSDTEEQEEDVPLENNQRQIRQQVYTARPTDAICIESDVDEEAIYIESDEDEAIYINSETDDAIYIDSDSGDDAHEGLSRPVVLSDSGANNPPPNIIDDILYVEPDDVTVSKRNEITTKGSTITTSETNKARISLSVTARPNALRLFPHRLREIECFKWNSSFLKRDKTVELVDGTLLMIRSVVQNLDLDTVSLRGWRLVRNKTLPGVLSKKVNEVCFIHEVNSKTSREPALHRNLVDVRVDQLISVRDLICTNRPFPELSYRVIENSIPPNLSRDQRRVYKETHFRLVARWRYIITFDSVAGHQTSISSADVSRRRMLRPILEKECSAGCGISESTLKAGWRQEVNKVLEKTAVGVEKSTKKGRRKYTYGDAFCGAGGTTRGAAMAGLEPVWGFDHWSEAAKTWHHNFPNARMFQMEAHEVAALDDPDGSLVVDILHFSPPCQPFSPYKRITVAFDEERFPIDTADDEMNKASLYAVESLLEKARPRVVTLEQTFGILHRTHLRHFHALIRMFTDKNFSISWQTIRFQDWGLPQRRKRIIIVASCPGQLLPSVPGPTHYPPGLRTNTSQRLRPYQTARSVLASVPASAANQEIIPTRRLLQAWDDRSLKGTICNENQVHPSGERYLTVRESAALQGFPHSHVFVGGRPQRQVGNAVPPSAIRVLFASIRRELEHEDGLDDDAIMVD